MPFWEYPHDPTDPDFLQFVFKNAFGREYDPACRGDWRLMCGVLLLCSVAWLPVGDYSYDFDKSGPYSFEIWEDMKRPRKGHEWRLDEYDQGKLDSAAGAAREFEGPVGVLATVAYETDHMSYNGHKASPAEIVKRRPWLDKETVSKAQGILEKHRVFRMKAW
ncbi:MAG: hypothetical protein J6Y62_06090 [Clostridia bacterium]|nr:hypothetical protein [Clostridia bacterium]